MSKNVFTSKSLLRFMKTNDLSLVEMTILISFTINDI